MKNAQAEVDKILEKDQYKRAKVALMILVNAASLILLGIPNAFNYGFNGHALFYAKPESALELESTNRNIRRQLAAPAA